MKKLIYPILGAVLLASCTKTQFDEFETTTSGSADFTKFVAVGNSLTQGHQDNGIHNEYQQMDNSYPAIIAGQMGASFIQPLVEGDGSGYKSLQDLDPTVIDIAASPNWGAAGWSSWSTSIEYNNLGVSGIRLTDCVPTNGEALSPTIILLFC